MKPISLFVLGVLAVAMSAPAQAQTTDRSKGVARRSERGYGKDATVIKWKPTLRMKC